MSGVDVEGESPLDRIERIMQLRECQRFYQRQMAEARATLRAYRPALRRVNSELARSLAAPEVKP